MPVDVTVENRIGQYAPQTGTASLLASVEQESDLSTTQFGKGFLLEVLKSSISRQTIQRRSNNRSSKPCNSSRSPYHSHGISSPTLCNCCSGKDSIRCSQGAKSCHDSIRL